MWPVLTRRCVRPAWNQYGGGFMAIAIGSDHAGFEQKEALVDYLLELGYDVNNCGPESDNRVDYPDYAETVAKQVSDGNATLGVLVCGTGIGMAIAANKIAGIRAANVITPEFAHLAREHNDANILTLSGRFVSLEENKAILDEFLNTPFGGGRHQDRLNKISKLEGKAE